MLTDIFLLLVSIPLQVILAVLGGISSIFTTVVPDGVFTSINTLFGYLGYFNSVFPIDTFAECALALTTFFYFYYIVKIALWAWSLVPWLGNGHINQLPTLSDKAQQQMLDNDQERRWRNYVKRKVNRSFMWYN